MHLIVTRPAQQADAWLTALQAAGHSTTLLPLIEVAPANEASDIAAWQAAVMGSDPWQALMFVSSNAVEHFFKRNQPIALIKSAQSAIDLVVNNSLLRCWATGPGTVAALLAAGVPAERIDTPEPEAAAFDSEALWQRVKPQVRRHSRVLIVRGRDVGTADSSRDWLAQQIEGQGGLASSLVVYERRPPVLNAEQLAACQTWLRDGSVWLLSSSQALRHLPQTLDVSQARCICTHERIAQAATARGLAVVHRSRGSVQDVIASIKSTYV